MLTCGAARRTGQPLAHSMSTGLAGLAQRRTGWAAATPPLAAPPPPRRHRGPPAGQQAAQAGGRRPATHLWQSAWGQAGGRRIVVVCRCRQRPAQPGGRRAGVVHHAGQLLARAREKGRVGGLVCPSGRGAPREGACAGQGGHGVQVCIDLGSSAHRCQAVHPQALAAWPCGLALLRATPGRPPK